MTMVEYFNLPPNKTNSHKYEFDLFFKVITTDKDIDEVHTYENQLDAEQGSGISSN